MPSAYSVPMASDVLPEPDTPTTATVRHSGTSMSTFWRLFCRAPRTPMTVGSVSGTRISILATTRNLGRTLGRINGGYPDERCRRRKCDPVASDEPDLPVTGRFPATS